MNWAAIITLLLQILPMILKLLPNLGPNTLAKYKPQLQSLRASIQAVDAALDSAGVSAVSARAAVAEEDITK